MATRQISDIVRHQSPLTLTPAATAKQACECMRDRRVGAVLVTEGDRRLVGIVSSDDFRGLEQDRLDEETGIWERI